MGEGMECGVLVAMTFGVLVAMTIILNNRDVELFDEPGAGFGKGEILVIHNELEKVAFGPADEALENVLLAGEVKGWVLVVVIRTDGPAAFLTGAF